MQNKHILVIILLAIFAVLSYGAVLTKGLTNDEITHIASGYSYLKVFDYRMNPEHPPLIKIISAIPLLFLNLNIPINDATWQSGDQWNFASIFFFVINGNADTILAFARFPMVIVGLLLGVYIFIWAEELFGAKSGIFALALFSFSPTFLANSPLVTTDVGVTAFVFIACYYFWHFCSKMNKKYFWLSGIFVGLALSAKYTGIYIVPTLFLLALLYHFKHESSIRLSKRSVSLLILTVAILFVGLVVLILTYGVVNFYQYLVGLVSVSVHSSWGHRGFLLGEYSENGWWYYFIIAFLVKEPIVLIFLMILAVIFWKKSRWFSYDKLFLLLVAMVFFLAATINRIDIGIRHILVAYPFLFVFLSDLINIELKKSLKYSVIGALGVWYIISALLAFPNYISYFNEFVGPENGYHVLIDSNIDWGQDLKPLKVWLEKHNNPDIKIAYFGTDDRTYRGIRWYELKCGPSTGLIAISVNHIIGFNYNGSLCSGWLLQQKPIDNVGHSILIYNITDSDIVVQREEFCKVKCKEKCASVGTLFKLAYWNSSKESCHCSCW